MIQSEDTLWVIKDLNSIILKKHSHQKIGLLEYSKENQDIIGNYLYVIIYSDGVMFSSKTT